MFNDKHRMLVLEMRCYRSIYVDYIRNDTVQDTIKQETGPLEDLVTTVNKRMLKWHSPQSFPYISKIDHLEQNKNRPTEERMCWQRHSLDWNIIHRESDVGKQQRHMDGAGPVFKNSTTRLSHKTVGDFADVDDDGLANTIHPYKHICALYIFICY